MGCAVVVRDGHGRWVLEVSQSFNHGSAFLSELLAVELGLKQARDSGYTKVECLSNCASLVNMLLTGTNATNFWDYEDIRRVR